jgi:hypothetical protein
MRSTVDVTIGLIAAMLIVVASSGCRGEPASVATSVPERARAAEGGNGSPWHHVRTWSGRGNRLSETFGIERHRWRVRWEASNAAEGRGSLRVSVHSGDSGRTLAVPVDHRGAGEGVVEVIEEPRQFYLMFESADLDWMVTVEEAIP